MSNLAPSRPVGLGYVPPGAKRTYSEFRCEPVTSKRLGGAVTGAAGDRNILLVAGEGCFSYPAVQWEWVVIGTQTILAPNLTAVGLDLTLDNAVAGDGLELHPGATARSPQAFTVGTDPGFSLRVKITPEDVSGFNPLMVGFRKVEAFQTDWNDYDELVSIGISGVAGDIKIATILNNAATVTTDTTQDATDATELDLEVRVSSAGVVTYWIAGAPPTTTAAFTFDNGEVVVPFLRQVQAADLGGKCEISLWDCGHTGR